MPKIKVNDINMYYEVHGRGTPIVFIRGLGGDYRGWAPQIPVFSEKYRVVLFDNRGVGLTDKPQMPYSTKLFADDTIGLMDQLGIEKAHFVGLSMGGAIAQQIGIHYPNRIKSLVLAATFAKMNTFTRNLLSFFKKLAEEGRKDDLIENTLLWVYTPDFHEKRFVDLDRIKELMALNSQPPYAYVNQNLACQEHDTLNQLSQITAPCLILVGKEDILTPPTYSEILHKGIPHSKLVILERGGHGLFLEETETANQAVLDFLAIYT